MQAAGRLHCYLYKFLRSTAGTEEAHSDGLAEGNFFVALAR
jgi:hypothetical protein